MNQTASPNDKPPTIIAMWSGPRNLSTAMMRSFGSRHDCQPVDEPFYAAYLKQTGYRHPMWQEIIADGETDPAKIANQCVHASSSPKPLVYQKHMTHHMLDEFDLNWIKRVKNAFLIRDPELVLASYAAKHEQVSAADIGFAKQREIFDLAKSFADQVPPVIDAVDIRKSPQTALALLCEALGIMFDPAMLKWERGQRAEDGIWASHWYDAVWNSEGFAPLSTQPSLKPALPPHLQKIADEVRPHYDYMRQFRLAT